MSDPRQIAPGSQLIRQPLILVGLVAIALFGTPLAALAQQSAAPEERMAKLINEARIAQSLNPLAISPELSAAAVAHTMDMVAKGYMEHQGLDGSTPQQRAARHGYAVPAGSPWIVVEVISARATPEAALNWLLSDRLHRGVVLRGVWREMGIGYVEGGAYGQLWTINFGCRPNVLPVVAEQTANGLTLRMTNEECAPAGGSGDQIGRATQMMVSERSDFQGAEWEPFSPTRQVKGKGVVYVKLRDARGREVTAASTSISGRVTASSTTPPVLIPSPASPGPTDPPIIPVGRPTFSEPTPQPGR